MFYPQSTPPLLLTLTRAAFLQDVHLQLPMVVPALVSKPRSDRRDGTLLYSLLHTARVNPHMALWPRR